MDHMSPVACGRATVLTVLGRHREADHLVRRRRLLESWIDEVASYVNWMARGGRVGVDRAKGRGTGDNHRRIRASVAGLCIRRTTTDSLVLLVGQDALTVSMVSQGLRKLDFAVHMASTFTEAIEFVAEHGPGIVVTELKLPDGNGLDLLSIIKVNQPDARVIIATSFGSIATAVRAIKWGAEDYLTKPVTAESILQAAERKPCQCTPEGLPVQGAPQPITDALTLSRMTWEHIHRVVQEAGSISRAARLLGVDRRSLRRTLAKHSPPERPRSATLSNQANRS